MEGTESLALGGGLDGEKQWKYCGNKTYPSTQMHTHLKGADILLGIEMPTQVFGLPANDPRSAAFSSRTGRKIPALVCCAGKQAAR